MFLVIFIREIVEMGFVMRIMRMILTVGKIVGKMIQLLLLRVIVEMGIVEMMKRRVVVQKIVIRMRQRRMHANRPQRRAADSQNDKIVEPLAHVLRGFLAGARRRPVKRQIEESQLACFPPLRQRLVNRLAFRR